MSLIETFELLWIIPHLWQVNEETGNRRPVMLTVQRVPRIPKPAKSGSITDSEREEADKSKAEETQTDLDSGAAVEMSAPKDDSSQVKETTSGPSPAPESDHSQSTDIVVQGLSEDMTTILIRACVSMISVPVDPDTLHATLRLCLRLTRNHHYAMMFAELKSTRMILGLTQSSGFNGFTPLVTLLFRHIIEDPATLRHTMEKVGLFTIFQYLKMLSGNLSAISFCLIWHFLNNSFKLLNNKNTSSTLLHRLWDQLWPVEQAVPPQVWFQAALVPEKSITFFASWARPLAVTLNALLKQPAIVFALLCLHHVELALVSMQADRR